MRQLPKLMIDSSIIVEALKENPKAKRILEKILRNKGKALFFVNPFVVNEVVFILLLYLSNLSAKTLRKKKGLIRELMKKEINEKILPFIEKFFILLEFNPEQNRMTYEIIERYGLLPTDAAILASCKYYNLEYLVSIDIIDFQEPCEKEGITLIDSAEKLKEMLEKE